MELQPLEAMEREGFEEVALLRDPRSGARAVLAFHDTSAGPAFGGIRCRRYRDEGEALRDALALALAMSRKCVLADIQAGGAKLVLLETPSLSREPAYRWLGAVVEARNGRYFAGPDLGTGARELGWVAEGTRFVVRPEEASALAEATAGGVLAALRTALAELDGETDLSRRKIVVQGLGQVGRALAQRLRDAGARVLAAEVDPRVAFEAQETLGLELLDCGEELEVACDALAPCAGGGLLDERAAGRLRARVVCGSANNPLSGERAALHLHRRKILFVPDVVSSAGALIRGAERHLRGRDPALEEIEQRIASATAAVLGRAREEDLSTYHAALREADARLRARRSGDLRDARRGGDRSVR